MLCVANMKNHVPTVQKWSFGGLVFLPSAVILTTFKYYFDTGANL
jgi:hypothetical protein